MTAWDETIRWDFQCCGQNTCHVHSMFQLNDLTVWSSIPIAVKLVQFSVSPVSILLLKMPWRHYKPYITNGVNSSFCDAFVDVPEVQPTIMEAFNSHVARQGSRSMSPPTPRRVPWINVPEIFTQWSIFKILKTHKKVDPISSPWVIDATHHLLAHPTTTSGWLRIVVVLPQRLRSALQRCRVGRSGLSLIPPWQPLYWSTPKIPTRAAGFRKMVTLILQLWRPTRSWWYHLLASTIHATC